MKVHYRIDIDCANCAREVEEALNAIPDVTVSIDFIDKRMTVEIPDGRIDEYPEIEQEIRRVSRETEPDFRMWVDKEDGEEEEEGSPLWAILIGCAFMIAGLLLEYAIDADIDDMLLRGIFAIGLLACGHDVIFKGIRNIFRNRFLDENLLMTLATVAALVIGYWTESVAIMVFYKIGEFFEDRAVDRAKDSVESLMALKVPYSTVIRDDKSVVVPTEDIDIGETVLISPGEMIPIDGIVETGSGYLDTRAMTGEYVPRQVAPGDAVLSGYVNGENSITVRTTCLYEDSATAKVLELIEESYSKKSKSERFVTRFAKYYTPAVVLLAGLIAIVPSVIDPASWYYWVYKSIMILVVSCPCALVISIPLTYFCGIGRASTKGILVKGSTYIEAVSKAELAVFDKTGTLTMGEFCVTEVHPVGMTELDFISLAASAEAHSKHPIARSISEYAVTTVEASDIREIPGKGVEAMVDGRNVAIGNADLMRSVGIDEVLSSDGIGTDVHMSVDGAYAGYLTVSDTIKPESIRALEELRGMGIRTHMLTGDRKTSAELTAGKLALDGYDSDLLPEDKIDRLEKMLAETKGTVVYIGDGINDAPSLTRADVGIAMGNMGSDAAIKAADIVLVDDDTSKVAEAVRISKKTQTIVLENIVLSLAIKFAIILLASFTDLANMWLAVFGDVGALVIAIGNATRALGRSYNRKKETCTTCSGGECCCDC